MVYYPESGLGNMLLGLSSTALLAAASCRRLALSWGSGANPAGSASFESLFERIPGVRLYTAAELSRPLAERWGPQCAANLSRPGHHLQLARAADGAAPFSLCCGSIELNQHIRRHSPDFPALVMTAPNFTSLRFGRRSRLQWGDCGVVSVRSNYYVAPALMRNPRIARAAAYLMQHGLRCPHPNGSAREQRAQDAGATHAADAPGTPFFGAISRHLFVPHADDVAKADSYAQEQQRDGTAIVAVHIRSQIMAVHSALGRNVSADKLFERGFKACVRRVQQLALVAGYSRSRVYVAADQLRVRAAANASLDPGELLPVPSLVHPYNEHKCCGAVRPPSSVSSGLNELLVLSRADGLVVYGLHFASTYSAVAASWAALRGAGQPAARARPWLGVFEAENGCRRVPDHLVDPIVPVNSGWDVNHATRRL